VASERRSGAERTRMWRARRAAGQKHVRVELTRDNVTALARLGALPTTEAHDLAALADAVQRLIDRL
jgi:hypothetical protein